VTETSLIATEDFTDLIAPLAELPGALLPILHALQDKYGYVPKQAVPPLAKALNLSRAEIHGVISYYHHFRDHPGGRHVIRLCRAEACQAVGADDLAEHVKQRLGCDFHGTSADGEFSLEAAYCLGQCATGPALLIDDDIHARVSPDRFDQLTQSLRGDQ
jgi:formate dehydrogenase subunit gamma